MDKNARALVFEAGRGQQFLVGRGRETWIFWTHGCPARIYLPRRKCSGCLASPFATAYGTFNLLSANPGHGRTAIGLRIHTSRSTSSSLRLWPWMCSSKGKDERVEEYGPRIQISRRLCSSPPVCPFVGVGKSCFRPTEMPTLIGIGKALYISIMYSVWLHLLEILIASVSESSKGRSWS